MLIRILFFILSYFSPHESFTQNVYELRKLSDKDWLQMSTQERFKAINISNNHAPNQTFIGDFPRNEDIYQNWGYDYYEMNEHYENYSFRGFENYNIIEDRRNKWYYNQFGDRLTKMTAVGQIWGERINDDGTSSVSMPGGYINILGASTTHGQPIYAVEGIWVARESTDDWAISAVGAGALRTKLTPLTISIPNINGMKVDFQSRNYMASVVNTSMYRENLNGVNVLLRGLQLQRKFGALTIGATYANMYNEQNTRDGGTNFKGTVNDYSPTPIYAAMRVVDDSPQDGNGPIIYKVRILVDGEYRDDIHPLVIMDNLEREKISPVFSKSQQNYYEFFSISYAEHPAYEQTTVYERIPKYLDYLYMQDYVKGWNSKTLIDNFDVELGKKYFKIIDPKDKPFQINGNEYVVYLFDLGSISKQVKRVQIEVTVANDYKVQTSQIYTKNVNGGHDVKGENFQHYRAEYWRTMAQAEGNIKDISNLRTIRIDYGFEVANLIYGLNAHFNYLGFKIDGEYVKNTHYYMFSDNVPGTGLPSSERTDITKRQGHRSSQTDKAYYLSFLKDWSKFGFGGEFFKMGKFYRPYMNFFTPNDQANYYVYNVRNDSVRLSMIEDNDDNDQYPDIQYENRTMGVPMTTLKDPDGVFPGNDLDYDGIPDNNKNFNNIPDYNEPYLMFDVDPDDFVFGNDYNNNNIPDFREDDIKYDTPYDLDRFGKHIYFSYYPQKNINLAIGSFRTHGVGADNRTDDDYFKTNIKYDFLSVGNIYAEYRYEKIRDNINDSFAVASNLSHIRPGQGGMFSYYDSELYFDEREYRNSRVNKLFLESKIRCLPSVILENHLKFERNKQIEGTMYDNTFQPEDIISTIGMVNKISYIKQWRKLTFSPGIKLRLYRKARSESLNPLTHYSVRIPLVYLKYRISDKTNITLAAQGLKGMELLYKDYILSKNDYRQINYIFQVENRTIYFGFDLWGGFGLKIEDLSFKEKYRSFENYKSSSFFVQMWLGY